MPPTDRLAPARAGAPFKLTMLTAARAILVLAPTVLAFFTGGYFSGPRDWAGAATWLAVVLGVVAGSRIPRTREAWIAIGGMALLAAWTLLSTLWAPVAGNAWDAGQIAVLYVGGLLASSVVLDRRTAPWVEVLLAAGTLLVIGYGMSERFLPGLLHFARSPGAQGRLEQPLTYWNAMGELAALGLVLAARIAGDRRRSGWLRAAAAAAVAPLGMGLYVSFSRGALIAAVAGLIALLALAPRREQWWAVARAVVVASLGAAAAAPFRGVTAMAGSRSARETQGAVVLGLLLVIMVLAAAAQELHGRRERGADIRLPRHSGWITTGAICAGLAIAIIVGAHESTGRLGGGAGRLTSLQSNRYDYWSVALRAFEAQPLHGVGAGGWQVWWLRYRQVSEFATDTHSLELQTLAELGVVGVAFLVALVLGLAGAARRALRMHGQQAAGAVAGLVVYVVHSPLDWDWQMPAVTLVAIVLGGMVVAMSSGPRGPERVAR